MLFSINTSMRATDIHHRLIKKYWPFYWLFSVAVISFVFSTHLNLSLKLRVVFFFFGMNKITSFFIEWGHSCSSQHLVDSKRVLNFYWLCLTRIIYHLNLLRPSFFWWITPAAVEALVSMQPYFLQLVADATMEYWVKTTQDLPLNPVWRMLVLTSRVKHITVVWLFSPAKTFMSHLYQRSCDHSKQKSNNFTFKDSQISAILTFSIYFKTVILYEYPTVITLDLKSHFLIHNLASALMTDLYVRIAAKTGLKMDRVQSSCSSPQIVGVGVLVLVLMHLLFPYGYTVQFVILTNKTHKHSF